MSAFFNSCPVMAGGANPRNFFFTLSSLFR
jgi:hypothetical protein